MTISLIGKDPDAGKDWKQETGMTEDEGVGWHHRLKVQEFQQVLGNGDRQASVCDFMGSQRDWHDWTTATILLGFLTTKRISFFLAEIKWDLFNLLKNK